VAVSAGDQREIKVPGVEKRTAGHRWFLSPPAMRGEAVARLGWSRPGRLDGKTGADESDERPVWVCGGCAILSFFLYLPSFCVALVSACSPRGSKDLLVGWISIPWRW
jgi:hypothetical protein